MTQIACANCGSVSFTAPQIVAGAEKGMDVVLCCSNCGQPMHVLNEEDPEVLQALGEFFAQEKPDE